jgi:hypothetical protein
MLGLGRLIMVGTVDENTDTGNTIPFIIEIRLNGDAICRCVLRMVG